MPNNLNNNGTVTYVLPQQQMTVQQYGEMLDLSVDPPPYKAKKPKVEVRVEPIDESRIPKDEEWMVKTAAHLKR